MLLLNTERMVVINRPRVFFELDSGGVRQDQDEQGSETLNEESRRSQVGPAPTGWVRYRLSRRDGNDNKKGSIEKKSKQGDQDNNER